MCHFEGEKQSLQLKRRASRQNNSETTSTSGNGAFFVLEKFKRQEFVLPRKSWSWKWRHVGGEAFPVRLRPTEMDLRVKMRPADSAVFKDDPHRNEDYNYVTRGSANDLHVFELMGWEGHLPAPVSELQAQQALPQLAARSAVCANKWAASLLLSAAQYLRCPSSLVMYELIQHI